MDLSKIGIFNALKNKLSWHAERQEVLARNIANANTPGYKPEDLKKVDFAEIVANQTGRVQMTSTHPRHMQSGGAAGGKFETKTLGDTFETTPVGNSVSLQDEMMKMQENSMGYQQGTSLYKKMVGIMRIAIGDRQ